MTKPRSPTELSLAELLEAVKGQELIDENVSPSFNDPIASFVQAFNIKPGKELISDILLHKLFKLWNKNSFINIRNFNRQFGQYIPSQRRNRRFYFVDQQVLKIIKTIEDIEKKTAFVPTKSKAFYKHFERFLEKTNLKPGELYVESDILYYVYNRWCDDTRYKNPLGYKHFISFCDLNFEVKRLSNSTILWYGVNKEIKTLITRSEVERWRQGRLRYAKTKKDYSKPYNKKEKTLYTKKQKKQI